jgi:hypothetical protein
MVWRILDLKIRNINIIWDAVTRHMLLSILSRGK